MANPYVNTLLVQNMQEKASLKLQPAGCQKAVSFNAGAGMHVKQSTFSHTLKQDGPKMTWTWLAGTHVYSA